MSEKLMNLIDGVNRYLKNHGLAHIEGTPADIIGIYEGALRSVWKLEDKEKRDILAIEIAKALKKYSGGKSIEAAYQELSQKLNEEEQQARQRAQAEAARQEQEARRKEPGYVPSFDELMNS